VIHLSLVYIQTPNRGHGVPSPYAAERSLVPRQPGGKEPARKAAVGWAPTAQETAAVHSAAAGGRGPPLHAGFRNPGGHPAGRNGNGTDKAREAVVRCWCNVAAIWAQICWAVASGRAAALFGASRLGLAPQDFLFSFLFFESVIRIFSLGKFQ